MFSRLPLYVSLTTLPSRIEHIRPTLNSLLKQDKRVDRIFLVLPMTCVREPGAFEPPAWLNGYPIEIVRPEVDQGPGSKLLGCLPMLYRPGVLVVVDDDMIYDRGFLGRLYEAQCADVYASFSFYAYSWGPLKAIGQGADGFSFFTPNLEGIEKWVAPLLSVPELRVHDDVWISTFLQSRGVKIRRCDRAGVRHCRPAHQINQLQHLQGDLARDRVLSRGVHYLVANGYFGLWRQWDHNLRGFVKRLMGRTVPA